MPIRRRKPVDEEIIDVDAIANVDIDNDDYDDDVTIDKPIKMVEDEPETMEDFIEKAMARQQQTVNSAMKSINKRVSEHDKRIATLEKQQKEIIKAISAKGSTSTIKEDDSEPVEDNRNVFDKTLGAVGGVMHGIVDTAAFVLESTVDLVTLGRAKRDY